MRFSEIIAAWNEAHLHLTHTSCGGKVVCNIEAERTCNNHSSY